MKQETLVSNATPRELREYQVEAVDAVEHAWAQDNNRVSVVLPTGTGKAEPVTNEIPTPKGIRRFGDLKVGDDVYGPHGKPVRVTAVHAQGIRKVYRLTFSDGVSTLADGDHLWAVNISGASTVMVNTTKEMLREGLLDGDTSGWRFQIPLCQPTSGSRDVPPRRVREQKLIDHIFVNNGTQYADGSVTVPVTHDTADIQKIVWSLGGTATLYPTCLHIDAPHVTSNTAWFRGAGRRTPKRFIISIEPAGETECRCITVDHPTSLYLTGRAHIVTHNSTVIASVATRARKEGKKVLLLAHRTELLDQMAGAVQAVDPSVSEVGVVAADRDENHTDIVAASFQTLARSPKRLAALGKRDVILADECFPAGTRIGSKNIEDVRVGDVVPSWDTESGTFTRKVVTRVMEATPTHMVKVTITNGAEITCTAGHPFLTRSGEWIPAAGLAGLYVVSNRVRGGVVKVSNVEDIAPTADGTFGGACPDGLVYNLEVEDTHTYLIEGGFVVHNCHHISAPTYLGVLENLKAIGDDADPDVKSCGFTATMYRDDGKQLGDVWNDVVYEKDLVWAIENGFLIKPKGKTVAIPGLNKLASIKNQAGDYKQSDLEDVMSASVDSTIDAIMRHCPNNAMIVFAVGVEHARTIAEKLTANGIAAKEVTGAHNREYREQAYSEFRSGAINALVTVQVLTEGADFPRCDTVVLARPTRSKVLLTQVIGRSVRQYTDPVTGLPKSEALVLDLTGVVRDNKLASLTDLFPEAEQQVFDSEGEDKTDDEEFMDEYLDRPSKKERQGRIDLEDIDLMGASVRRVLWLRTGPLNENQDEVTFMPLKHPGEYVFLYPPINRIGDNPIGLGYLNRHGAVSFFRDAAGNLVTGTLTQAMDGAEKMVGPKNFIRNDAGWRRPGIAPSERQVQLGRNLGIAGAETRSRGDLSDRISEVFAAQMFRDVVRRNPGLPPV